MYMTNKNFELRFKVNLNNTMFTCYHTEQYIFLNPCSHVISNKKRPHITMRTLLFWCVGQESNLRLTGS